MSIVYEAEHESLARRVALKVLAPRLSEDARARARFEREARTVANMHHSNIVPLFEVGEDDGRCFIAMQLIAGRSLDRLIHEMRTARPDEITDSVEPQGGKSVASESATEIIRADMLSSTSDQFAAKSGQHQQVRTIARIGLQAASALAYAHKRGIVHRDIKPSNILIDDNGVAWLTDFGLAKAGDDGVSQSGDIIGTLRYMSPERFQGTCDGSADVYALGLTLYELLTLRPAFEAADYLELIHVITNRELVTPRSVNRHIPVDLETIVLKAADKDPTARYSSEEMAKDLRRFLGGEPIAARKTTVVDRVVKWVRRRPTAAAVCFLLPIVLLLAAAGTISTLMWQRAEESLTLAEEQRGSAEKARREADEQRISAEQAHAEAEKEKILALIAKKQADTDRARAVAAELEAKKARLEADRIRAGAEVTRAHFEWGANRTKVADQLLMRCPEKYRDWEWHYVHHLCHAEEFTLHASQPLSCVAYSPDGKLLAAGGKSGEVFLWKAKAGEQPRKLSGHKGWINSIAFSPDGKHLLTSSLDATAAIRNVQTGQRQVLRGHLNRVTCACFTADGKYIATSSGDGSAKLWLVSTGDELRTFGKANSEFDYSWAIFSVCISPDGTKLITTSRAAIRVWDPQTGKLLGRITDSPGGEVLRYAPDRKRLGVIYHAFQTTKIIDEKSSEVTTLRLPFHSYLWDLAFNPSSKQVALASSDRRITIWDGSKGTLVRTLKGHTNQVSGVAYNPDGSRLASVSWDGTLKVWNPHVDQTARTLGSGPEKFGSVWFSPDSKRVAATVAGHVRIYDTSTGRTLSVLDQLSPHNPVCVCFHPDGQHVAVGIRDVHMIDISTGQMVKKFGMDEKVESVHFNAKGDQLACASSDGRVHIWEIDTSKLLHAWRLPCPAHCVRFSPDGQLVAAAGGNYPTPGIARVWDVRTGELVHDLQGHVARVYSVCFSHSGERMATASADHTVRVWDTQTGKQTLQPLIGHHNFVNSVCFSPDDNRLLSGGWDGKLRLWDTDSGEEVMVLSGPKNRINVVAFSPDGRLIVGGGEAIKTDGSLILWAAPGYQPKEITPVLQRSIK